MFHIFRVCNTSWRASKANSDTKSRWNWPVNWELHYRNNFPECELQCLSDNLNLSKLCEAFKAKMEGDSEGAGRGVPVWALVFVFFTNFSWLPEDMRQTCALEFRSFQGYWLPEGILVLKMKNDSLNTIVQFRRSVYPRQLCWLLWAFAVNTEPHPFWGRQHCHSFDASPETSG